LNALEQLTVEHGTSDLQKQMRASLCPTHVLSLAGLPINRLTVPSTALVDIGPKPGYVNIRSQRRIIRLKLDQRTNGQGLRADRERAPLCVAYETLARRGELVALELRDVEFWPNGTGQALIRRGKTDAEGQGRVGYLSRETVKWLKIWLEHAKINEGPVFSRLIGRDQIGDVLHPGSTAPIFKRVAQWIGMPARYVDGVSGHSTRVGAAQDLAELDIDLAAITQAGGWKSTRMPLQYAEMINAARSGMARAVKESGRD
jgi:integrase